jgi:hypothetical protein
MVNYKTFYLFDFKSDSDLVSHDDKIKSFIKEISEDGHTFLNVNTTSLGGVNRSLRTEITYKENHTRKVIVEKT